jgi:nicotinamide-nucleotide amidase
MSAEILCIGTELVVGDNRDRLIAELQAAAQRCRVLITTGGLGPTPDDLTTEAIAAAFEAPLVEHPQVWAEIQARLAARGRPCAASNRRQAFLPEGAALLPNPTGTAPGMVWSPRPEFTILTFPGVPSEMRAMWEATAAPWLRAAGLAEGVFASRMLHFWGVGESNLAEQMADLLEGTNPTVAPYAGSGEVKLRITARAATADAAAQLLEPVETEIRARTGALCFGVDEVSLASVLLEQLRRRGQTLAVAESCTGGGLGAALAAVPGASDVLLGGVIAYANSVKQGLLGVPAALLEAHGAVSDPVARAMAEGARSATGADWALAITGVAGPGGGSPEKPVGLVHIAVAGSAGCSSEGVHFGASRGRSWIQTLATGEALNRLRLALLE